MRLTNFRTLGTRFFLQKNKIHQRKSLTVFRLQSLNYRRRVQIWSNGYFVAMRLTNFRTLGTRFFLQKNKIHQRKSLTVFRLQSMIWGRCFNLDKYGTCMMQVKSHEAFFMGGESDLFRYKVYPTKMIIWSSIPKEPTVCKNIFKLFTRKNIQTPSNLLCSAWALRHQLCSV